MKQTEFIYLSKECGVKAHEIYQDESLTVVSLLDSQIKIIHNNFKRRSTLKVVIRTTEQFNLEGKNGLRNLYDMYNKNSANVQLLYDWCVKNLKRI